MWVPAWKTMAGGIRCLRLYEVSEIPCKSMAVFWHFFYCPGKGILGNKEYFVGYHTLYGMEPKWYYSFFCGEEGNQAVLNIQGMFAQHRPKRSVDMRSRHLVSTERTLRKSISCKAAAWAKPKDFRDERIRVPVIRISGWINKNLRKGEKRVVSSDL